MGAVVGLTLKYTWLAETAPPESHARTETPPPNTTVASVIKEGAAWQYARACQEGNWAQVLDLTLWVDDRLKFVGVSGTTEDVAEERARLIDQISTRDIEENQLGDLGVEDQYVFTPGARIDFVMDDEGRGDLELAVARRTWINVIYPSRPKALLDLEGLPIHSLTVGINVSLDGRVLKAGVIGNLDIDWDSIRYDWPPK